MAEYTQGPWMVRPDGEQVMTQWQNIYDSRRPVCDMPRYHGIPDTEHDANARLITAAPDMYEALKAAVSTFGAVDPVNTTWQQIHAALAKAEGK